LRHQKVALKRYLDPVFSLWKRQHDQGKHGVLYGLNQIQRFEAILNKVGRSLNEFTSVLDFGCGHGRLTRHFFDIVPDARITGCDVLPENIQQCAQQWPEGHFVVNQSFPPLLFENEEFDFIYSYSVFTHLSEKNHKAWLRELARLLRPGGIMIHTLHSYTALERMDMFSPSALAKYKLSESVDVFKQTVKGYHYVLDDPLFPEYGSTIISQEYVLRNWESYSGLSLLRYVGSGIESYPEGCHDIVILGKDKENA
jgi:2-polyprenyl-3-methyl-5-hydroxy-6-metoxy-1,4-benzoquinol methylase